MLTNDGTGRRPSLLDEFKPYLHQRWNAGCTNATRLFEEIKAQGYRGQYPVLRPFRASAKVPEPAPTAPKVRRVVGWIMRNPENMTADDQRQLDQILSRSPELTALAGHVRSFATMMCSLRGELVCYALDQLATVDRLRVLGPPDPHDRGALVSFVLEGVDAGDVGSALDRDGVAVRIGRHCAHVACARFGVPAAIRASFYLYNDVNDVDSLVTALRAVS